MEIKLANVKSNLDIKGIDIKTQTGFNTFSEDLHSVISCQSWSYSHADDVLTIEIPEGTTIPDLSFIGEVVDNDSSTG